MTAALVLFAACRSSQPVGEQPIAAPASAQELIQRRDRFEGQRSVVRIRITNGSQTQSARAQLQVGRAGDMLMTVYAPIINTAAIQLYAANGRIVFVNHIDGTAWQGNASAFSGSFGFIAANPAAFAFLILGLPPREATITYGEQGIQSARLQDMVIAYDPPVYPPKKIVIVRGTQRVEIEHLEDFTSPGAIAPLTVPAGYRCCILPQI